jgi:Tol biopolymer transport system component
VTRLLLLAALVMACTAPTAAATLPGRNGKIAFADEYDECYFYASLPPRAHAADCSAELVLRIDLLAGQGRRPKRLRGGYAPSFSPSGRRLAFQTGGRTILVRSVSGKSPDVRVATNASDPTWSPTGRRIAFSGAPLVPGATPGHYVLSARADGTDVRQLTAGRDPDWAADGKIAFVRDPGQANGPLRSSIFMMGAFGESPRLLTRGTQPSWSPHGRMIAFSRSVKGKRQVFVISASGGKARQVTRGRLAHHDPAWSPDGRRLVCVRSTSYRDSLVTMRPDGSRLRLLYRDPGGPFSGDPGDVGRTTLSQPAWQPLPRS